MKYDLTLGASPRLIPGTLIGRDMWYVVCEVRAHRTGENAGRVDLLCVCDNANNIYSWEVLDVMTWTKPHKAIIVDPLVALDSFPEDLPEEHQDIWRNKMHSRPIPYDVIAEALAGKHENRFSHWYKV